MPRPKKAPRVRLQITLPKMLGQNLRKFAKSRDRDISAIIEDAVSVYLRTPNELPIETEKALAEKALAVIPINPPR